MKKVIILTIATILLIFASISARELIQTESDVSDQKISPTETPVIRNVAYLTNKFTKPKSEQSEEIQLTIETIGGFDGEIIKQVNSTSQWKLNLDNKQLEVTLNTYDSTPYGSDLEPEVMKLKSQLTMEQLYRIKVYEGFYFYTDSYYTDSCSQKYCSNGLVSIPGDLDLSIYCTVMTDNPESLEYCDEVVKNLRLQ